MSKFKNNTKNVVSSFESNFFRFSFVFCLLFLTILIYKNSLKNDFQYTYDDDLYIINNSHIHDFSIEGIKNILYNKNSDNYSPTADFLYSFQYWIDGANPFVFHSFSLFIHILNSLLLFLVLLKLFKSFPLSFFVTALFSLHPLQSEAVLWVSAASTLYYTLFYLLSIFFYLKFKENNKWFLYIISFGFFLLSVFSKVAAVSLPIVLLIIDYYKTHKIKRNDVLNKVPFFIFSIILILQTYFLKKQLGSIGTYIIEEYSSLDRILIFIFSYTFYILKIILPINLSAIHFYPGLSNGYLPLMYYVLPFILGGAIYGLVFITKKYKELSLILFSILFYTISILPHLQIIPVGGMVAERYSYLASVGVFILLYLFVSKIVEFKFNSKVSIFLGFLFSISLLISFITYNRTKVWNNSLVLFNDVTKKYPHDYYSWFALGFAKYQYGDNEGAVTSYNKSIDLNNSSAETYTNRGNAKLQLQDLNGAINDFNTALKINPGFLNALNNRAVAKSQLKQFDSALNDLSAALKLDPLYTEALNTRGIVFQQLGKYPEAIRDFTTALYFNPNSENLYFNRANTAQLMKAYQMALKDYTKTISLNNKNDRAYLYRANVFYELRDLNNACNDWAVSSKLGNNDAAFFITKYCSN